MQTVKTLAINCGMSLEDISAILDDAGISATGPDQAIDDTVSEKLSAHVARLALRKAKSVVDSKQIKAAARRVWDKNAELRAEFNNDFAAYFAYEQACARGLVRVIGGIVE